jgi:hypothetical protein
VPFDSLNPGHQPRFDATASIRRIRRVVLLAPSLAILLALAAAGAASAADGLDLVGAAPVAPVIPSVDPKTTLAPTVLRLAPVRDRVVKAVERALPNGPAQVVEAIVRRAEDKVGAVAPVPIPAVIPPELYKGPDNVVQPRRAHPHAADADRSSGLPSATTTLLMPDQASSHRSDRTQEFDGNLRLRPLQPTLPLGPLDSSGTGSIGGSGTGSGPWLGHGLWPRVPPAWQAAFPLANALTMPRGLTPRPLVPPG